MAELSPRDVAVGRRALERRLVTREQLDQARQALARGEAADLLEALRPYLPADQAAELEISWAPAPPPPPPPPGDPSGEATQLELHTPQGAALASDGATLGPAADTGFSSDGATLGPGVIAPHFASDGATLGPGVIAPHFASDGATLGPGASDFSSDGATLGPGAAPPGFSPDSVTLLAPGVRVTPDGETLPPPAIPPGGGAPQEDSFREDRTLIDTATSGRSPGQHDGEDLDKTRAARRESSQGQVEPPIDATRRDARPSEDPSYHASRTAAARDPSSAHGHSGLTVPDTQVYASPASGLAPSLATTPTGQKAPPRKLPERIGDYQVLSELGRGGMGVVYAAKSQHLGRKVALKVLLGGAGATENDVARFLVEAKAAGRLRHPNIVRVLEHSQDERGDWFLAMDLIEGESLHRKVERTGPLPEREAATLAKQLANALHYAHKNGILHRDIKPHNVLLDEHGVPLLTDFGLAKLTEDQGISLTGAGPTLMGTPGYMPPEQAGAEGKKVDPRSDVYSLGATLYYMLTGRAPFQGKSVPQVMMAVVRKRPLPPSRERPDLSTDLETICLKCLEKESDDRYASAEALEADLARFLGAEEIVAKRPGLPLRLQRWAARNPEQAAGAAALFLVLLLAAAGMGWAIARLQHQPVAQLTPTPSPTVRVTAAPSPSASGAASPSPSASPTAEVVPTPTEPPPPPPDIEAPGLALLQPAEGLRTRETEVPVEVEATDDRGVTEVLLGEVPLERTGPGRFAGVAALGSDGVHVLTLVARDAAGNQTEAEVRVERDTTPPELVACDLPEGGAELEASRLRVALTLSEPGTAELRRGDERVPLEPAAEQPELLAGELPLNMGPNRVSITVRDALGNERALPERELVRVRSGLLRDATWWEPSPLQARYAEEAQLPVVVRGPLELRFVLIPPARFTMGSPEEDPLRDSSEVPHEVELTRGFYLSATEVTNEQLRQFLAGHQSGRYEKPGGPAEAAGDLDDPRQPAVRVSWDEARDFCAWLSERAEGGRYRLPTEAEWEWACRAGTTTRWYWGDQPEGAAGQANVADDLTNRRFLFGRAQEVGVKFFPVDDDGYRVSAPVASFAPNPFGLYDMVGNVSEWCADWLVDFNQTLKERDQLTVDPTGPEAGKARVFRGGDFTARPAWTRSASRRGYARELPTIGFRVVWEPAPR